FVAVLVLVVPRLLAADGDRVLAPAEVDEVLGAMAPLAAPCAFEMERRRIRLSREDQERLSSDERSALRAVLERGARAGDAVVPSLHALVHARGRLDPTAFLRHRVVTTEEATRIETLDREGRPFEVTHVAGDRIAVLRRDLDVLSIGRR